MLLPIPRGWWSATVLLADSRAKSPPGPVSGCISVVPAATSSGSRLRESERSTPQEASAGVPRRVLRQAYRGARDGGPGYHFGQFENCSGRPSTPWLAASLPRTIKPSLSHWLRAHRSVPIRWTVAEPEPMCRRWDFRNQAFADERFEGCSGGSSGYAVVGHEDVLIGHAVHRQRPSPIAAREGIATCSSSGRCSSGSRPDGHVGHSLASSPERPINTSPERWLG